MTYAPNGDPLTANDLVNGNWAYAYDYFNRLKTAAKTGLGLSYTYDRYGNRWKQTVTPPGTDSPSFSFTGSNNRIDQLCHDAAGNVLDDRTFTPGPCPADLNTVRFRFDAENRLISVDGGATGSYVYDAEGRRVRRVEQATVRNYVYDLAGRAITEIGGNGSWVRGEIYAGGRHLGTYVDGKTYFAHSDWLGTERLRSRLIGTEKERFTSWPFGDHLESSGGNSSTLHFTGKERDAESGLDYFGARYFSSNFGRWMSPDWAFFPSPVPYGELTNPQALNLYQYIGNNPLSTVDADGHCWPPSACADAIDAAIDKGVNYLITSDVASGDVERAANGAFVTGVIGDIGKGFSNLLRVGSDIGNVGNHVSQGEYLQAANDVAQDGARTVGIAALVIGAVKGAARPEPNPSVTKPYERPSGATTPEQRAAVQGQPCVDCGTIAPKMVANHKTPLVKEYYKTGQIDKGRMRSVDSVNAHCPTCSAKSGAPLSRYSIKMKEKITNKNEQ